MVNSFSENRDSVPTCGESRLVHGTFDPIRATGDNHPFVRSRRSGEFAGNMIAVGSGSACPRDRDEVLHRAGEKGRRTASPQHLWVSHAQIIECSRPVGITRNECPNP